MKHVTLFERLKDYAKYGDAPLHMPGHKRNRALAPYLGPLGARLDITEIPGFDDLHESEGILKEAQDRAAALYGSSRAFFLVNGSTGGLLAGIRAATRRKDRVLVARNCHKAVYHAMELCALTPVFLNPPVLEGYGCGASIHPDAVRDALEQHPDIRLVILTSPGYEGIISDVGAICGIAHGHGVPVLVDEAHGAHLGLDARFPPGAVSLGADLVIQSVHKMLPSLTQTGVLHWNAGLVPEGEVARQLAVFQTSSPSYLLMASLDGCVDLLERRGRALFEQWESRLNHFDDRARALQYFEVLGHGAQKGAAIPGVYGLEPSKLVISTRRTSLSGVQLMERLRREYHIQLEMALGSYAIAMTGMGDSVQMMDQLAEALLELEETCGGDAAVDETRHDSSPPQARVALAEAVEKPWKLLPYEACRGRISAEYVWAYPPGIPLIIPGEAVDDAFLGDIRRMAGAEVNLIGTRGRAAEELAVLEEE